jgi:hypothetical protein
MLGPAGAFGYNFLESAAFGVWVLRALDTAWASLFFIDQSQQLHVIEIELCYFHRHAENE